MGKTTEEKLNIQELGIGLKEKHLSIIHTPSSVTKSGKVLGKISTEEGNQPVHKDMLDVLQLMVPHLCMIVGMPGFKSFTPEYLENEKALEDEKLEGFYVTGFSLSAKGGITVKGGIKTDTGRVTAMNAPLTSIDEENSNYEHVKDLNSLVQNAFKEAAHYFIDGKFGEGAQPEIFSAAAMNEGNQ